MNIDTYYNLLAEKLTAWMHAAVQALPNLVIAILIVLTFVLIARLAARLTRRVLENHSDSSAITNLAITLVKYAVIAAGFFIALGVLGLQKTVFSLLAGAGVVGLAVGFAFQDLASNLIAGVAMGLRKPFRIGDVVETRDFVGSVEKLSLRNTLIRTFSGELVLIPNKEVFENPLMNFSTNGERRVEVEVGISYDDDLNEAIKIATEAAESLECRNEDKDVEVLARSFGGSSINLSVRYWITYPGDYTYVQAADQGIRAIKAAFDANKIDIPFPIRTLDFSKSQDSAMAIEMKQGRSVEAVAS